MAKRGARSRRVSYPLQTAAQKRASAKLVREVTSRIKELKSGTLAQVRSVAHRESQVSNEIHRIQKKLLETPAPRVSRAAASKKGRLTASETKQASKVHKELWTIDAQTRVFNARANLLSDSSLTADTRIKLLNQMEDSVYEQEATLQRLKRLLTSPKVLITLAVIGLAAYGLYQTPTILKQIPEAAKAAGEAAKLAGDAAQKTNESGAKLVNAVGCAAASVLAPFAGPLGLLPATYCLYQAYKS